MRAVVKKWACKHQFLWILLDVIEQAELICDQFLLFVNPVVCGATLAVHWVELFRTVNGQKKLVRVENIECVKFQFWLTFPVNKSQVPLPVKLQLLRV